MSKILWITYDHEQVDQGEFEEILSTLDESLPDEYEVILTSKKLEPLNTEEVLDYLDKLGNAISEMDER